MNKEFIPYEQALELKELGFECYNIGWYIIIDEKPQLTFQNYSNHLCAPLYQQAFRWFREKYGLVHCIGNPDLYPIKGENFHIGIGVNPIVFEEVELACLKKLIEIAKNK